MPSRLFPSGSGQHGKIVLFDSFRFSYRILYIPNFLQSCLYQYVKDLILVKRKVENNGFEPLTPCLQSRCSSQLS